MPVVQATTITARHNFRAGFLILATIMILNERQVIDKTAGVRDSGSPFSALYGLIYDVMGISLAPVLVWVGDQPLPLCAQSD
jgi:hypothetical protein